MTGPEAVDSAEEEVVDVVVAVDEDHVDHLADVGARLREAGMAVDEELPVVGTIPGSVAASRISAISAVRGVSVVEPARRIQIPPPESETQ